MTTEVLVSQQSFTLQLWKPQKQLRQFTALSRWPWLYNFIKHNSKAVAWAPKVMMESEELAEISTITPTFTFTSPPVRLGSAGDRKTRPADPFGDPSVCSLKPWGENPSLRRTERKQYVYFNAV